MEEQCGGVKIIPVASGILLLPVITLIFLPPGAEGSEELDPNTPQCH
ncbi:hypothetical protein [Glutamicibacter nicotianae]|nr:hypothetical protein [Glutamicibacter nicotianae]